MKSVKRLNLAIIYILSFPALVYSSEDHGIDYSIVPDSVIDPACRDLFSQFPSLVTFPNTTIYTNESTAFWSQSCVLLPSCIFTPKIAQQIARSIGIFKTYGSQFQVRSGGHMPFPGAASTNQGIMIAMSNFKVLQPSADKSTVQIGSGLRWQDVYDGLRQCQLMAVGGRYAPVGVGGLLIGGGISHFSSRRGWAANQIQSFEVITADGKVRQVSSNQDPDLFWALKGGSSNFGIVSSYVVRAFTRQPIYGGIIVTQDVGGLLNCLDSYLRANESSGINDIDTAIDVYLLIDPNARTVAGTVVLFRNGTEINPESLQSFSTLSFELNTAHVRDYSDFQQETVSFGDRSQRQSFYVTAFKASREAIQIVYETVVPAALKELHGIDGVLVSPIFQPVSRSWLEAARGHGGDAIDLNPADAPLIILDLAIHWNNTEDDARIRSWTTNILQSINQKTKAADLYSAFIFLNDAGPGQRPFSTYGNGKSINRLKRIRKQYDPNGVFQALSPGGFKLGF